MKKDLMFEQPIKGDIKNISYDRSDYREILIPLRYLQIRRAVEVFLTILIAPLVLLIVISVIPVIAIESRGGVFYTELRPGKDGKLFTIFKLRTMYKDAPTHLLEMEGDIRITRWGRWLRRTRIDELPQLLNILRGEMSWIGPRPAPARFYSIYRQSIPGYDVRLKVLPGITGLAQLVLGYTNTLEGEKTKMSLDIEYISKISTRMDLRILGWTILKVLGIKTVPSIRS